ncbi:hypothetical protein EFM11_00160 [Lactobacillus helveticus]|nr:hypothetical protein [Lactobacillus helveticus]MCT0164022.1 hypothetical protein [Lactobacillus helveticus]
MTNYSADGSNVVKRWRKDGYLYCAFVDGTIMEFGLHKIANRYIEVDRFELYETIYELKRNELTFDELEPMEA